MEILAKELEGYKKALNPEARTMLDDKVLDKLYKCTPSTNGNTSSLI